MNRSDQLFSAADRIGFELCREAIRDGQACNWMGWASEVYGESVSYTWQSLGPTVYDGTAGVADFLASLFKRSGEALHRSTSLAAIRHAMEHCADPGNQHAAGVFSGTLGIALTAIKVGQRLETSDLVESGLLALQESASALHEDQEIDVIGGSAGAIPILIAVGKKFELPNCFDHAVRHGELILKRSTRQLTTETASSTGSTPFERLWKNPAFGREGLTGYSHGNAGFANALLELFHLTADERYREAAREALVFERRWFVSAQQNWCDLRVVSENAPAVSCAWCHGAPGIGLARLRTQELLPDDPLIAQEIATAIATTLQSLVVSPDSRQNFSLCHGLLGNAELPLAMRAKKLNIGNAMQAVEHVLDFALDQHAQSHTPWKCGTQDGRAVPGLMLGTAGIGLSLLRRCDDPGAQSANDWLQLTSSWFL